MTLNFRRLLPLTLLLVTAVFLTGCFGVTGDSTYRLTVTVVDDETSEPLSGIEVAAGDGKGTTDEDGEVTFTGLSGTIGIAILEDDYQPYAAEVNMNQNREYEARLLPLSDVVDTAIAADDFNTLVAAVVAAGLEDDLRGDGPFTVFAPTDEAFDALPAGLLASLLDDTDTLADVLLYHVLSGEVLAEAVLGLDGEEVETLQGGSVTISIENGDVFIDDAQVIVTDIQATNGVIHVIDAVISPEPLPQDIVDTGIAAEGFDTLVTAIQEAGLESALRGEGPFTVFAPTDEAFDNLPDGVLDDLLDDPDELAKVLLYHVLDGKFMATDVLGLDDGTELETLLENETITLGLNGGVFLTDNQSEQAEVTDTDVEASNGVIHVIDRVLIP